MMDELIRKVSPFKTPDQIAAFKQKLDSLGMCSPQKLVNVSADTIEGVLIKKEWELGEISDVNSLRRVCLDTLKMQDPSAPAAKVVTTPPPQERRGGNDRSQGQNSHRSRSRDNGRRNGNGRDRGSDRRRDSKGPAPHRRNGGGRRRSPARSSTRHQGTPNKPPPEKPALWRAVEVGDANEVEYLLDKQANPEEVYQGWTPLMKAAEEDHSEIVHILLKRDVDIEAKNRKGRTALSFAAAPSEKRSENEVVEERPTALRAMRTLLDAGADANHQDSKGKSPKNYAKDLKRDDALDVFEEYEKQARMAG
eukprot:CAMPEP_0178426510 /NCGR_PEP_ID=MMETSP0689_2-20121128/29271_1 /TAXON_ID=160604 /ORGANISM="Amphidinium massartii, Strain CS-259" /LENGTH=307 /DNA_ID=CAMNT_0020048197 /DNA_START=99 /DNA_END=1022 /DNA_ORIENTATION=-